MQVLAQRERINMVSGWNEYLCLTDGDDAKYRLFTGRYTALAPRFDYLDSETGDYDLPDEIEGEKVVTIEDDWIVGGDLDWCNDQDTIQFDSIDDEGVADWLDDSEWSAELSLTDLNQVLTKNSGNSC